VHYGTVYFLFYGFVADSWSISQAQSNNSRAQRWLVISHFRPGVSPQSTLGGVKHLNSAPTRQL